MVSGQYEFGFSNTTSLLVAASQGLPLKVVTEGVASTGEKGKDFGGIVVAADSPIKTAADLAGKRVAVNTLKNINTTTTNKVVRDAGGDPSKIAYTELAFPDIVPAVTKGDVDAGRCRALPDHRQEAGAARDRLQLRPDGPETDGRPILHLAEVRDRARGHGQEVRHRNAEVAEVRQRQPGRGPGDPAQLHQDRPGRPGGGDAAQLAGHDRQRLDRGARQTGPAGRLITSEPDLTKLLP